MREANAPVALCASILGVSPSTVFRHAHPSASRGISPRAGRVVDEAARRHVCDLVRATHGLMGASSLGKASRLPRRVCGQIKRRELREIEIERKALSASVSIASPGIVRGFDAMHLQSTAGKAYWLVAADAAVPFRTSIATVASYDAEQVIRALVADFEHHGAPLVLRLDRIACQRTVEVDQLLARYQVLALHGPPRHPRYYGQLERQNREHRGWYATLGVVSPSELTFAGEAMRTALNDLWRRPTLDWCTAQEVWERRKPVEVDRVELRHDVVRRTASLIASTPDPLRARRIAIESALIERGLLTINPGGRC